MEEYDPQHTAEMQAISRGDVIAMFEKKLADADAAKARTDYIGAKLNDIPPAYSRLMPATTDPVALAEAEQRIRQQFVQDFHSVQRACFEMSSSHYPSDLYTPAAIGLAKQNAGVRSTETTRDLMTRHLSGETAGGAAPPSAASQPQPTTDIEGDQAAMQRRELGEDRAQVRKSFSGV